MTKILHPAAGALALMLIVTFWISTVLAETLGGPGQIVAVKTAIPWGFLLLVPALATVGGTGTALGRGRGGPVLDRKRRRIPIVAANGLLVLMPSAFFLAAKARAFDFDAVFYAVQTVELAAGAVNITLLGRNMRDGLRLTRGRRPRAAGA